MTRLSLVSLAAAASLTSALGCRKTTVVERPSGSVVVREPADRTTVVAPSAATTTTVVPMTQVVAVQPAPPPPAPVEVRTVSPAPDYIWVEGAYDWSGSTWTWVPGHWVRPIQPAATWEPGHWQTVPGGYQWTPGHWR